jgi:hypothetical protein
LRVKSDGNQADRASGKGVLLAHTVAVEDCLIAVPPASVTHQRVARPLHRLALELGLVIIAKISFLLLIWWLLFLPHPKPDASADAIAKRLAPAAPTTPESSP